MKNILYTWIIIFLLPQQALAHLYWIEPAEFYYYTKTKAMDDKVSETLTFEFSGGDVYFNADTNRSFGDDTAEYSFTYLLPDGSTLKPTRIFNGQTRLVVEAEANQKGTYTLAISRTGEPMYYAKLADDSWVAKAKDELTEQERLTAKVHGGYFQHSKSYITLHEMSDNWKKPLGHSLEIIPLSHPNHLYVRDSLPMQVLYQGKALAGAKLHAVYQGYRAKQHGKKPITTKTDEQGKAVISFDKASRWLITVKHSEATANQIKADSHEHQASLMLEVNQLWVKEWAETN